MHLNTISIIMEKLDMRINWAMNSVTVKPHIQH